MLSNLEYAIPVNYYPWAKSQTAINSKIISGKVKNGNHHYIDHIIQKFVQPNKVLFDPFLDSRTSLVPMPRSAPLTADALWPAMEIAQRLHFNGFGKEILPILIRSYSIRKSHSQTNSDNRPSVQEHYDSFTVNISTDAPEKISIIDDVVTQGRTAIAAASRLQEAFPDAEIQLFAMVRSKSFSETPEIIVDPSVGNITYNPTSKRTFRHDV